MSDFAECVQELRAALAAQFADPQPCSWQQAFNRDRRVTLARMEFARRMALFSA